MTLLRLWFIVSGSALALGFIWAYVPILIPLLVVAAGLGGVTFVVVTAARRLERWRDRR